MSRIHRWAVPAVCFATVALAASLGTVFASPAQAARVAATQLAYVDPGAGSFILQALVAGIAGAAVAVSAYWRRIKRFFGIGDDSDEAGHEDPSPSDE